MEKSFFYEKFINNLRKNNLSNNEIESIFKNLFFEKNTYFEILNNLDEGLIVYNEDDKLIFNNRKAEIFFNNIKKDPIELVLPCEIQNQYKLVKQGKKIKNFILPMKIFKTNYVLEFKILKLNKTYFKGILIVFYDINAKMKAQQESSISTKLKNILELTYSVAHEIRNPLTGMDLNLKLLQQQINAISNSENPKCKVCVTRYGEKIDLIRGEVVRLNKILEKFLETARPLNPKIETVDINQIIKEIFENLKVQFQLSKKSLVLKLKEDLPLILIDPNLLKQALINIIKNGFEAIEKEENGTVIVSTYEDKENIIIEIKDNGIGIPDDIQKKIFDPFYTTKSNGSGLGLSIVYKIIVALGAEIDFKSKVNEGTTFYIYFDKKKLSSNLLLSQNE